MSSPPPPSPGDAVRIETTKWVDRPHWQMPGRYLGRDEHGDWVGFPVATYMSRPGAEITTSNVQVGLVPPDAGWLATFHGPGGVVWTYVDMTTVPVWDGTTVRAVDLDLDIVEGLDRVVYVDDQDEFDEHRVEHAYPDDVVALAERTRDQVLAAVRDKKAPFDGTATDWFARLEQV